MTNTEAMHILTKLINNVPHSRGDGKSLTKSQIIEALAMGIYALTEQEKNDKRRNQMTACEVILGILTTINILFAFANAKEHDICQVVINCTIALIAMMSICRQEYQYLWKY